MTAAERLDVDAIARLSPYVDAASLASFRARTTPPWTWVPRMLRAGAVTLRTDVTFREGRFDPSTPAGLALIAHECTHIRQYRDMGTVRFLLAYARGAIAAGFVHDKHPLEREPNELQARAYAELVAAQS